MAFLFYRLRYSDVYFFSFFSLHFFFLSLSYLLVKKKQQRTKAAHNEHYIDICLIFKKKRRIKRKKKKHISLWKRYSKRFFIILFTEQSRVIDLKINTNFSHQVITSRDVPTENGNQGSSTSCGPIIFIVTSIFICYDLHFL